MTVLSKIVFSEVIMERLIEIGSIQGKNSRQIKASKMGLGFEKLDRDAFDPSQCYEKISQLGCKWARIQSGWAKTEKTKGVYDFTWLDQIVDQLIAHGLKPWICLCYGNGLYSELAAETFGAVGVPPIHSEEAIKAWENYVRATVEHYKGRVDTFEIWNEPDGLWCWKTGVNATELGAFTKNTGRYIKEVNRDAYVIGGVVCSKDLAYLNEAMDAGLCEHIDAISFHEYTHDESGVKQTVEAYKSLAKLHGYDLDIVQGESGSQSRSGGCGAINTGAWTQRKQAKQLLRHAIADLMADVKFTSYFSCMDMFEALNGKVGDAKYVSAVENSNFSGVIMASIGNHDQTVVGNANFKRYAIYDGATKTWVGIDNAPAYFAQTYTGDLDITVSLAGENLTYYFATIDNNAFVFMDQELGATGGTTTQDNFSKAQLNFVEEKLYTYSATHNLFIVEHAPVEQLKVGDKFVPGYGGCIQLNFNYPNNQRFLELLQEYTEAIWLSGHTHVQYDVGIMYVDKYYDADGNLTDTPIAHSVHVSSLAQPRWYEGKNMIMQNDFSAASQGYVCYQYADDLAIEARSFKDYTPNSTSFDASLFINEVNSIYSMMIPLETKTHEAPTALVDLAVAANGVKRQGNVTFADTAEGLQVTFEAANNRFEIKTGNQVKAYNNGYYLQFKIKTDLTSITLGGCNYAGNRYTSMVVDLTTAGENYTVIDLGDSWKFVQIPFSALGYVEYLPEFAIRFYNTNAAGTFLLKEMFIEPFDYSFMRGETFAGGSNKTITLSETATSEISFEYRIMDGQTMRFAFLQDWSSYFGYYLFNANGEAEDYAGITTEKLSDGYVKVTANISEMNYIHSDATTVTMLYISGGDAGGYIDNVQFIGSDVPEEPAIPEDALEIATGMSLNVEAGVYEEISFEYMVTNEGVLYIAALSPDWGKYYGYYEFNANGKVWEDNGVYCELLDNGFYRVTLKTAEMDRTNNAANADNRPETIGLLYVGGNNTATGYIRNIQLVEAAQPTAVDYAVAENGVKRAGSPTWEDTADGLQVTFAAANNRFEIKCGDQTAAANGTLQFKIKTDLTSINLGGCNYSGGRKTNVPVNLTASGEKYTVTDLGDGWVLVEVPMSQIGVADYLAEFAIRFYDTNAAGTFYLKDMNFIP